MTLYTLVSMRIRLIKDVINWKRRTNDVAEILWVTRKTIHKWKCRYQYYWEEWLLPRKPWPKRWTCRNRTKNDLEIKVMEYGNKYPREWPVRLSMRLYDECWIKIHQSTVYRILKRKGIRYYEEYARSRKRRKKNRLYALDTPWVQVQVDTSFPYWRKRNLVIYSAIDDCTRKVYSRAYRRHCWVQRKDSLWA